MGRRIKHPRQQVDERRLAAARTSHNAKRLPWFQMYVNVAQNGFSTIGVAELSEIDPNVTSDAWEFHRVLRIRNCRSFIEKYLQAGQRCRSPLKIVNHLPNLLQRHNQLT